jgi:hypothetical protein
MKCDELSGTAKGTVSVLLIVGKQLSKFSNCHFRPTDRD